MVMRFIRKRKQAQPSASSAVPSRKPSNPYADDRRTLIVGFLVLVGLLMIGGIGRDENDSLEKLQEVAGHTELLVLGVAIMVWQLSVIIKNLRILVGRSQAPAAPPPPPGVLPPPSLGAPPPPAPGALSLTPPVRGHGTAAQRYGASRAKTSWYC